MNTDKRIKIQRIDGNAVDINGQRFSTEQALQYLRDLAQEFGQGLYTQEDIENAQEEGQESGVDAFAKGYDEGFEVGHKRAKSSHRTIREWKCAHCDKTLCQEHIQRLSDNVSPRIDVKDICNIVFELSDYNESCKK